MEKFLGVTSIAIVIATIPAYYLVMSNLTGFSIIQLLTGSL